MTKSIKDIATDAFMAGRKSMELEFKSKGRAIQRPIDAQIKEYTKDIEAIIQQEIDKARLNEVQSAYEHWINGRKFISSYFRDRIAELSSSKDSK